MQLNITINERGCLAVSSAIHLVILHAFSIRALTQFPNKPPKCKTFSQATISPPSRPKIRPVQSISLFPNPHLLVPKSKSPVTFSIQHLPSTTTFTIHFLPALFAASFLALRSASRRCCRLIFESAVASASAFFSASSLAAWTLAAMVARRSALD